MSALPDLCLDHLLRMTDDTGIIQHATYSVPARQHGLLRRRQRARVDRRGACGSCAGRRGHARAGHHVSQLPARLAGTGRQLPQLHELRACPGHDAAHPTTASARAIWALGVTATLASDDGCRQLARDMLARALPHSRELGPRGTALAVLGLVSLLAADPGTVEAARTARQPGREAVRCLPRERIGRLALVRTHAHLRQRHPSARPVRRLRRDRRPSDASLRARVARVPRGSVLRRDQLQLVGNTGWHSAGGEKACADEQAIDATALRARVQLRVHRHRDTHYLRRMRESFAWFLGANRLGLPLYDSSHGRLPRWDGHCARQSEPGRREHVCFLLALLEMLEVDGEELEHRRYGRRCAPHANAIRSKLGARGIACCRTRAACWPNRTFRATNVALPGASRAHLLMARVLAIPEAEVEALNADIARHFDARHRDLTRMFELHFETVAHHVPDAAAISAERRLTDRRLFHARVLDRRARLSSIRRSCRHRIRGACRAARSASS